MVYSFKNYSPKATRILQDNSTRFTEHKITINLLQLFFVNDLNKSPGGHFEK